MRFQPLLFLLLLFGTELAQAARVQEPLFLGARKRALGGSYVALADDHEAIFYNPAGMADVQSASIKYLALDIESSTDIYEAARSGSDQIKKVDGETINLMMGKTVYGRGQLAPTLLLPYVGATFLFDHQYALSVKNKANPDIQLGIQRTRGVQLAFGLPLNRKTRSKRKTWDLSLGLGVKMLWRQGGYRALTQSEILKLVSGQSFDVNSFAGAYRFGVGFDSGFLAKYPLSSSTQLSFGTAYTDIGGTKFGGNVATQTGALSLGTAFKFDPGLMHFAVSYEYSPAFGDIDTLSKQHFGLEFGVPFVTAYGGFNQVYYTFGGAVDVWVLRIVGVSYGTEQASHVRLDPSRRYLLRLEMKFDL